MKTDIKTGIRFLDITYKDVILCNGLGKNCGIKCGQMPANIIKSLQQLVKIYNFMYDKNPAYAINKLQNHLQHHKIRYKNKQLSFHRVKPTHYKIIYEVIN